MAGAGKKMEAFDRREENGEYVKHVDEVRGDEKIDKNGRARPRKDDKEGVEEAEGMKKFLEMGKLRSFEVKFGSSGKVEHSPVKGRGEGADNEENVLNGREERNTDESVAAAREVADGKKMKRQEESEAKDKESENETKEHDEKGTRSKMENEMRSESTEGMERGSSQIMKAREMEARREAAENMISAAAVKQTDIGEEQREQQKQKYDDEMIKDFKVWMECRVNGLENRINKIEMENIVIRAEKDRLDRQSMSDKQTMREMYLELRALSSQVEENRVKIRELEGSVGNLETRIREMNVEGNKEGRKDDRNETGGMNGNFKGNGDRGRGRENAERGVNMKRGDEREGQMNVNNETREGDDSEKTNNIPEKARDVDERRKCIPARNYLKNMPDALSKRELEWETAERKVRKKNISIKGIRTVGREIGEEVKEIVKRKMDLDIYIRRIRAIGGGIIVELDSFEN